MELFRASNFRLRKIYGLPTIRGLYLFALLGGAMWYAVAENSEVERWIFLLMILLVLVHLSEVSQPFQKLQVQLLPFEIPFAGDMSRIPIQFFNQDSSKTEQLSFRIDTSRDWIDVGPLSGNSSAVVYFNYQFKQAGKQSLPRLIIRNRPRPHFFRFWKIIKFTETILVLPQAVDHHFPLARKDNINDDELSHLEQIRDPRYLPMTDQKLLQKTGIAYRRVHRSNGSGDNVNLCWSDLEPLDKIQKAEQFSYWLKSFSQVSRESQLQFSVSTPFMEQKNLQGALEWRRLKLVFAKWYYEQA